MRCQVFTGLLRDIAETGLVFRGRHYGIGFIAKFLEINHPQANSYLPALKFAVATFIGNCIRCIELAKRVQTVGVGMQVDFGGHGIIMILCAESGAEVTDQSTRVIVKEDLDDMNVFWIFGLPLNQAEQLAGLLVEKFLLLVEVLEPKITTGLLDDIDVFTINVPLVQRV